MFCGNESTPISKKDAQNDFKYEGSNQNDNSDSKSKWIFNPVEQGNNRCSRGLKVLSVKVRDIVYKKKRTSYKEVAEALISENHFGDDFGETSNVPLKSHKQKKNKNKKKAREEQNVKRRVYDALNVLIAAEVLKKTNKTVYFNEMGKKDFLTKKKKESAAISKRKRNHYSTTLYNTLTNQNRDLASQNTKRNCNFCRQFCTNLLRSERFFIATKAGMYHPT